MARFNEILAGRYNRFLQKLFQLKGGPPAAQLASEVMPVFPFFSGREHRYLEGWNTYSFQRAEVATAAITSVVRIRNPVASNTIAIFERIIFASVLGAVPVLRSSATTTDLPTVFVTGNKRWDPRSQSGGTGDSALITSENSGAGGVLLQAKMTGITGANGFFDFIITDIGELPLLPGDAIEVDGNVVNQAIAGVTFLWRERSLEDSELK